MASNPGVWRQNTGETSKKLANSCEVTYLKLSCGGGSAVAAVYDAQDSSGAVPANLKWLLDVGQQGNDNCEFDSGLNFTRGVFVVLEQGDGFNPVVCMAAKPTSR
jgi:hypothetical protein